MCTVCAHTDEEFAVLKNLTQALIGDETQYVVHLANSLFLQTGVHFSPEFLKLIKHYFHAEAETVDFNESAAVAQHINAWVQNHTASKYTATEIISFRILFSKKESPSEQRVLYPDRSYN